MKKQAMNLTSKRFNKLILKIKRENLIGITWPLTMCKEIFYVDFGFWAGYIDTKWLTIDKE